MVIKMDKSEEFIKSGKKLISEYEGANLKEDQDQKPEPVSYTHLRAHET